MTISNHKNAQKIAFLGTGSMGLPMARRLCEAGNALQVWNRTPGKADSLTALGARVHAQAGAAVTDADIVVGIEHGLTELDHSGLFVELASRNGIY